jgi:hypothetical protein
MNRHQLQCSVPHSALQCPPTTTNLLLHRVRLNRRCARVSILRSDALVVALSARHSQNFRRKQSSHVRNAAGSAPSSCSAPDSHQETFHFIRFKSLNPRGGSRGSMVKPIARKPSVAQLFLCYDRSTVTEANVPVAVVAPTRSSKFSQRLRGISNVGRPCTRVSNAPAGVCLSLHSGAPMPHLRDSRLLPFASLR